jgi:NAD(P)-dependent dehydrogenase (short-subunit alcohol dehydrogenase family)
LSDRASLLTGRAALITGGRRIGAAVAVALAQAGADVGLCYRSSRDEAEETAAAVRACGRRAVVLQADLTQPDDCRRLVREVVDALGRLDVLFHLASVYQRIPYDELTDADWERALAVDVRAAHLCAQAAVPHLRAGGRGRIVNFADWVAASGRPRYTGYVPYYVAKAAVVALTEVLALELAPDGILVNAIAPGPILAPPDTTDDELAAVERATPLGRWGGEGEIVKAALFLVETEFVTGETIRVDGGRHLR